jgi:hypothetical protein
MSKPMKRNEEISRRDMLKKAGKGAAFVAPGLVSFNVDELQAKASGVNITEITSKDKKPKKPKKK